MSNKGTLTAKENIRYPAAESRVVRMSTGLLPTLSERVPKIGVEKKLIMEKDAAITPTQTSECVSSLM